MKASEIKMKKQTFKRLLITLSLCTTIAASSFVSVYASNTANTAPTTAKTTSAGIAPKGTPPQGTPPGAPPNGAPGGSSQGSSSTVKATAVYETSGKTASVSGKTYTTTTKNKSGVIADKGSKLVLKNISIKKNGGDTSSEDQSNFYGLNAALVSKAASTITVSGAKISSSADGSNGVFSTGAGSVINVSNTTIQTTKGSSRGLDATMGGKINATNVTISTKGIHCAAIATDRGNGTINVTGGAMTTAGQDSPGIYSTGTIKVTGATIKATGAEAAVVEGRNSITLTNVNISGTKTNGVMLYQSFSGDAETGTAAFTMTGGTLSSMAGALFFITNTDAVASLKNVAIKNTTDTLISAAATSRWGTAGSNGGKLKFTADHETLSGKVICDNISSVSMTLKNNTSFTGSINTDNKLAKVVVSLDKSSKWNVKADSYVSALTDNDVTLSNIQSNGHTVYYDASNSVNSWLGGKTITLSGGGTLAPVK